MSKSGIVGSLVLALGIAGIAGAAGAQSSAGVRASASLIEQHALAQQGLSIGLASALFEIELNVATAVGKKNVCHHRLPGVGTTGSLMLLQNTTTGATREVTVELYYDRNCQQRYVHAHYVSQRQSASLATATETATLYSAAGKSLGDANLNLDIGVSSQVRYSATGTFAPAHGSPVKFGFSCAYSFIDGPVGSVPCRIGVAQSFAATGNDIASVTPIIFTVDSTGPTATFVAHNAQLAKGATGALGIAAPTMNTVTITGAHSAIGIASSAGTLAEFSPFPQGPTSWHSSDSVHDVRFLIALADGAKAFKGTIKTIGTKATLATFTINTTGNGSIVYSDNSKAAVTSWTLAN